MLGVVCGCVMPKTPGELVGAYHISGALTENSCGTAALPAADRLSFDVEIRRNKSEGLWIRDAPPPHSGRLDQDGSFAFEFTTSYAIQGSTKEPAEAATGVDPAKLADPTLIDTADQQAMQHCQLSVQESVQGMLLRSSLPDAGATETATARSSDEADLMGDNQITIRATAGSNCRMVLAAQNGPFDQLPCHARYELKGELK